MSGKQLKKPLSLEESKEEKPTFRVNKKSFNLVKNRGKKLTNCLIKYLLIKRKLWRKTEK